MQISLQQIIGSLWNINPKIVWLVLNCQKIFGEDPCMHTHIQDVNLRTHILSYVHAFKTKGKGKRRISRNDFMVNVNDHDLTTKDGEWGANVKNC